MKVISIPFAISNDSRITEEEYLPGLLLEIEGSKKGGWAV